MADLPTWWSNFAGSRSGRQLFRIAVAIDSDSANFEHFLVSYSLFQCQLSLEMFCEKRVSDLRIWWSNFDQTRSSRHVHSILIAMVYDSVIYNDFLDDVCPWIASDRRNEFFLQESIGMADF